VLAREVPDRRGDRPLGDRFRVGAEGSWPSRTREKVPSGWMANCRLRRRDGGRTSWAGPGEPGDEGGLDERDQRDKADGVRWPTTPIKDSDDDFTWRMVGPTDEEEGLAWVAWLDCALCAPVGFTPETRSSRDRADEKPGFVGDGNADPGLCALPSAPSSIITSSLVLGRLA